MDINILEYLNENEIKEACVTALSDHVRSKFRSEAEIERIISNTTYRLIKQEVEKTISCSMEEMIIEKTKAVIDELGSFTVFYKGGYGDKPSKGYLLLEQAVIDNQPLINEAVKEQISKLDFTYIQSAIEDRVASAIATIIGKELSQEKTE